MNIQNNYVVIMAGGAGTRFWPYSRNDHPKQFLDVLGTGRTLLQMTFERFLPICPKENVFVVTNEQYKELVSSQLPELADDQILTEPVRRNTAPCIAYACHKIAKRDKEAVVIVSPSDHAIFKEREFEGVVSESIASAQQDDRLITIGIKPSRPETGYGYIQFLESDDHVKKVKTFTEKPKREMAETFLKSGDFVWNAGIFIWSVNAINSALGEFLPEMNELFLEINDDLYTDNEGNAIKKVYSQCKNISIDYGVMEKAKNVFVVLGDFGWSDLGSWNSLHDILEKDENDNVIDANALIYDSKDLFVKASKDKLVVVEGLEGYLVTEHEDVILVCQKDNEKKFREFVSDVKTKKNQKYL
ncbi:MAG: mannose-1-phosphate guanylyltransferase [Bacteroidota bacterium]